MTIVGDVTHHRLERLCVTIPVMLVNEFDALVAAQVIERLFERQPEMSAEFGCKDEYPFQLILITVCHSYSCILFTRQRYKNISELPHFHAKKYLNGRMTHSCFSAT